MWAELRDGHYVSRSLLERQDAPLMSCARDDVPTSAELLWCADADSPLCLPALPSSSAGVELWDGPLANLVSLGLPAPARIAIPLHWERPAPEQPPASGDRERLERPPRA